MDVNAYIFGDDHVKNALGIQLQAYLEKYKWGVKREGINSSTPNKWLKPVNLNKIKAAITEQTRLIIVSLGGAIPLGSGAKTKELGNKLVELTSPHLGGVGKGNTHILWLGAPPKTGKGGTSSVVETGGTYEARTDEERYKKNAEIQSALQDNLGNSRFAYIDPIKNWEVYLPVYATLKKDNPDLDKWVKKKNGTIMQDWGAFEYIDNIVKNWAISFPNDPYL